VLQPFEAEFRIMTRRDISSPITVLQLTDLHLHAATDSRMRGVRTHDTFIKVLNHAEKSALWPADIIVVTGDIVQDESRAGYDRFRSILADYAIPVLCIPGNHDDPKLMAEILSQTPFQSSGEFRIGGWSVILLSTFLLGEDAGGLGPTKLRSLDQALQAHANRHVLICMHHHALPLGSRWLDGVALRDADEFRRIIDAHSNVRAIICGHVHQESDLQHNDIRFLSTPSTCAQFMPRSEFFALDDRPPGLRWLRLEASGHIDTQVSWIAKEDRR